MKPDWKVAPKWANWAAMDGNGEWYWYEQRPSRSKINDWWISHGGRFQAVENVPMWDRTLEQRPDEP